METEKVNWGKESNLVEKEKLGIYGKSGKISLKKFKKKTTVTYLKKRRKIGKKRKFGKGRNRLGKEEKDLEKKKNWKTKKNREMKKKIGKRRKRLGKEEKVWEKKKKVGKRRKRLGKKKIEKRRKRLGKEEKKLGRE